MTPPVLVTGATGRLGRAVIARLVAAGVPVRALSRHPKQHTDAVSWVTGDVTTGAGIGQAVDGAGAIVHLASAPYRRGYTREVEIHGTQRLLEEAAAANVQHIIYTSIIGCDRIPWGYFRTKTEAEGMVAGGPVPSNILRLGQFHDFVDQTFRSLARTGLLVSDRRVLAQPVDTADVAERIHAAVRAGPSNRTEEFAGPEVLSLRSAAEQWSTATGTRRFILPVRIPGKLGRAFRAGHLTTSATPRGVRTWRDHLASRYGHSPTGPDRR
ncbi:MAG TPA: NAD(P)H-binding protein [Candidatus Ruania gallistercoris]|uniref:NAD(P)H-binding protein n=1 Tax=Candidatus Ruania gallistercoris TaxID=2838746 RepID=A0A9D2J2V4_9MICO|nr:NAD(P)H-binding protein [Candidatus Ruania gallistercoris]